MRVRTKTKGAFSVTVSREDFGFSAGHVMLRGDDVEALHGHSYRVALTLRGDLTDDAVVVDFRVIKRALKTVCESLNHRVLVPSRNPLLEIAKAGARLRVSSRGKCMEIDAADALCLPLLNITAELLALHIFEGIAKQLDEVGCHAVNEMTVEVSESPGQSASFVGVCSGKGRRISG